VTPYDTPESIDADTDTVPTPPDATGVPLGHEMDEEDRNVQDTGG